MHLYVNMLDIEYTIRMYLHYRDNYRTMLTTEHIKRLDDEYFSWITDTDNRYGDNGIYKQLRNENGFGVSSIFFDTTNIGEFIVECRIGWNNTKTIRLKSRGKSDHSGIYDVIKIETGCEHWNTMI